MARPRTEEGHDLPGGLLRLVFFQPLQRVLAACDVANTLDKAPHGLDEIGDAGRDRAPGHHRVFRLVRILHENDSASLLYLANADGPIRARPAQYHRGPVASSIGHGPKEQVDRRPMSPWLGERPGGHAVLLDHQFAVGRDDVDTIRLEPGRVVDLPYRHSGPAGEDLAQLTVVIRRQVNDYDIGQPEFVVDTLEELLKGPDTAGGGSDGANRDQRLAFARGPLVDFHHGSPLLYLNGGDTFTVVATMSAL